MTIITNNNKLLKVFSNFKLLAKDYGFDLAKILYRRIAQLQAYETIEDLFSSNLGSPHFLSGELEDCIAISLTKNVRLILSTKFISKDINEIMQSKIIEIKGVVDYHGSKNRRIID